MTIDTGFASNSLAVLCSAQDSEFEQCSPVFQIELGCEEQEFAGKDKSEKSDHVTEGLFQAP